MNETITKQLFQFIEHSPSCYHVIDTMKKELTASRYEELFEYECWQLKAGGKYYVTRGDSSIIAFSLPQILNGGFHITASHSDSPAFKLKEHAEMDSENNYVKLNTEKYGGMLMGSWLDRPLSIAGRICIQKDDFISSRLVNIDRDLVLIPNLAVHMNRESGDGQKYNPQIDLLPLYGELAAKGSLIKHIAEAAAVPIQSIISSDLFLYNRMQGSVWGANHEFISCPRLDDLQCAFSSLKGLLDAEPKKAIAVHCVLDNEEVGSSSKQGAASTFLADTLHRISLGLNIGEEQYHQILARSFMISADNAHAVHPNQPQKADPTNRPFMNKGIVIKYSANQKYTTDAVSAAIFKTLCEKHDVPFQTFFNRSDMAGGSTLGNISSAQVPVNSVDIGLAQLAMHSPYETAGVKDTVYLIEVLKSFYESSIVVSKNSGYFLS